MVIVTYLVLAAVSLLITTKSRIHLANIMRKIRVMPNVLKVSRQKN